MKNEYTITKRLMKSWVRGWYFDSIWNTVFLIFMCICGVFFFICPQLYIYYGYKSTLENWYTALWTICHAGALFCILCISLVPRAYARQNNIKYKTYSKNYCVRKWKRSIELTESEITVYDHTSVLKFEYSTIKRVKEKRKVVIIFLKSGFEIRLYKNAFVTGSWEECKKLLSRKSSIDIK